MTNPHSFPDPYAGPQSHSAHQPEKTQLQLDWLTDCVFALQEQNRQLYEQVAMLNKAVQQLLNLPRSKQQQSLSKENEEKRHDNGFFVEKHPEKSRKSSRKAAPTQVVFEKGKEQSGKRHENAVSPKTLAAEKGQNPPLDGKTFLL